MLGATLLSSSCLLTDLDGLAQGTGAASTSTSTSTSTSSSVQSASSQESSSQSSVSVVSSAVSTSEAASSSSTTTGGPEPCAELMPGLGAYFRFDGDTTNQVAGGPAAATEFIAFGSGVLGQAVSLGVDSRISLGDSFDLGLDAMTFAAWVRVQPSASGNRALFQKGSDFSNAPGTAPGWSLGYLVGSKRLQWSVTDGVTRGFGFVGADLFIGEFHWVVFSVDMTSMPGRFVLAVDGVVLTASTFDPAMGAVLTSAPFMLGGHQSGVFDLDGALDEVVILTTALTSPQIAEAYACYTANQ